MRFILTLILATIFNMTAAQQSIDFVNTTAPTSSILLEQLFNKKELKNNMVRIETVTFPPGYSSKIHTHPCPLFVYIIEGELLSEFEGEKKTYKAGDVFYEKPNGIHSITQNNSSSKTVKFLVVYFMKEGMETYLPLNEK